VRVGLDGEAGATVAVRDDGRWRPEPAENGHRGHGLRVMRQLADELELRHGPDGTELRLRLSGPSRPAPAAPVAPSPPVVGPAALLDGPDGPRVEGDLDHQGAAAVRAPLLRRVAAAPGAVVDLTAVGHLGSAGVGLLAEAAAAAPGLRVRVAPGSAPARVLALAGVVPTLP
jgi:ABC-type transporter Mla MlaB component